MSLLDEGAKLLRNELKKRVEVAALDLYRTFEVGPRDADNFTCELYRLISKADGVNRRRLFKSFPLHVDMYEEWMRTEDRFAFYRKYECEKNYIAPEGNG